MFSDGNGTKTRTYHPTPIYTYTHTTPPSLPSANIQDTSTWLLYQLLTHLRTQGFVFTSSTQRMQGRTQEI